jgi:tRNA dimethylallyltransferase
MSEISDNAELCREALQCWFVTGATASGKTGTSLSLAKKLNAEIISLDSMAIYRGMDIGTAKPSPEQQAEVPHHLIDVRNPNEAFSVNEYRDLALETAREIRGRGKEVLFVGGTALYLKALLRGLFDGPPADWEFRKQIEAEVADVGNEALHSRLAQVDPVSAHKLHVNDRRRLIRALEVYKLTGKPISHWQMEFSDGRPAQDCKVFSIRHPRPILHERIEGRVEQMFEQGLIREAKELLAQWDDLGQTASQAVGYREVIEHIRGERDLDDTYEKVRVRTRRFARHQETWFRGLSECEMVDIDGEFDSETLAERILQLGQSQSK